MPIILDGTAGIANNATDISYTGTLTGSTGVVNIGSGQVYKDASGNVGIGTTSPATKLEVSKDVADSGSWNSAQLRLSGATNSNKRLALAFDTTGNYGVIQALEEGIAFRNLALNPSGGNLLVGTTSLIGASAGALQIKYAGVTGRNGIGLMTTESTGYAAAVYNSSASLVGSIFTNGTTTAFNTSSDYRLKNTIAPMTGALAKVALLKPVTYKWNADNSDGQGFIAHELAEVEPGCVAGEKDAVDAEGKPQYQGIDTSFLVATLTAAIQELKAIIDTQATRITALEAK